MFTLKGHLITIARPTTWRRRKKKEKQKVLISSQLFFIQLIILHTEFSQREISGVHVYTDEPVCWINLSTKHGALTCL